jgi:alkylation response protein AidB-like acyl-CoA dehydrogenase
MWWPSACSGCRGVEDQVRFAFTEQQLELRGAVRQVLARECTVADLRAMALGDRHGGAGRTHERWSVLAELGATGLLVPQAHGGLGLGELELVGVLEEAGWAGLPEPLLESAGLAAPLMAAADAASNGGAGSVLGRFLEKVAAGEVVATVGGIDVTSAGLVTTTTPSPEVTQGTVVTPRVTGASVAGVALVALNLPGAGWQLHLVEADPDGVTTTPSIDPTRDLGTLEWSPWPHTLIASGERAEAMLSDLADRAALFSAAQLLGLTERMITMAADYAKERRQFGKPIGSFQAVKHHLANARVALEFARPTTYRAADSIARDLADRSAHASMAKAMASDAADLAARVALQVHGAIGYTWECDLQLWMKRAWVLSAAWGDAPTHRSRVLSHAMAAAAER